MCIRDRYSFLGFDPAMELTCMNHQVTITTDHVEQFETENPAQVIARVIDVYKRQARGRRFFHRKRSLSTGG